MKTKCYLCMGALATVAATGLVIGQVARDVNAQQATTQTQQTDATDANQRTDLDQTNSFETQPARPNGLQNRNQVRTHALRPSRNRMQMDFKASELIGMNVRGKSGDNEIGEIHDMVLDGEGKVKYVAVSFGGFLGLGEKLFAVPFEAVEFVREGEEADDLYARIDVTEERLENRPGFNQDNWPDEADPIFLPGTPRTARQVDRPETTPPADTNVPR